MEGERASYEDLDLSSISPELLSLSIEQDLKILNKILRHHLIQLHIPNMQAHILSQLLLYGDSTEAELQTSISKKKQFSSTLDELLKTHVLTKYVEKNSRGRKITYFKLNYSGKSVYNVLYRKSSSVLTEMVNLFENFDHVFQTSTDSNEISSSLTALGFERTASNILIYLHFHPETSLNDLSEAMGIDASRTLHRIRQLYSANYVRSSFGASSSDSRNIGYSLAKSLSDIALEYTLKYVDNVTLALDEVKYILHLSENLDQKSLRQKRLYAPNVSQEYIERIREQHRDISNAFTSGIHEFIIENGSKLLPLELVTTIPLPPKLRVYLYELRISTRKNANNNLYKIRVQIPEQENDPVFVLDNSDDAFILLGGYNPELQVFVFWDAYRHLQLSKQNRYMSVPSHYIFNAISSETGYIHEEWHKRTGEYVIVTCINSLSSAIIKLFESHIDDLCNAKI